MARNGMTLQDCYATLGLTGAATLADVKVAYRTLARRHHPDLNPHDRTAEDRFKQLSAAYEMLCDRLQSLQHANPFHSHSARSAAPRPQRPANHSTNRDVKRNATYDAFMSGLMGA